MISIEKDYILYKNFVKKRQTYHNIFFLADLMRWMGDGIFLSAEQIRTKWAKHIKLIKNKQVGDVLNFYIHIPFCKSKCNFCMYYSRLLDNKKLDEYISKLIKQINFFKKIFSGLEFNSLYIGGGTPSVLSEKQIKRLFDSLFASFKFNKDGEKTFECNPQNTTFKKLKLLKKYGFNRISFGVQSFDKKVLTFANRNFQNYYNIVREIVKNAKVFGFEVNTDLMIGLKGESVESIINSSIELAKIQPDSITFYPFKPPEEYIKKYYNKDNKSFLSYLDLKVKEIYRILKFNKNVFNYNFDPEWTGYEILTSAEPNYFSNNFSSSYKHHYDYTSPLSFLTPCSLFALGTRASSYIFNSLQYHVMAPDDKDANLAFKEKEYWAMRFNLRDEMRYFIIQQLSCRLCFSQKKFREFFHSDFKDNFQEAVDALESLGKIKFDNDLVFLPSDPLERYACALFFFEKEKVRKKINDFFSQSRLKITVNGKELTIKISAIRKNKKYHLSTKNFGFHLSASKDTCQFTNIEKQAIRNLFPLFKIVELENNPESAEEMMNFSRKSINKILLSQRKNFLKNSLDLRVSIER
ncbi:MAG: radical SAM protein, partial [bacterium]|nr:radical SAM protein [bacterium]